MFKSRDRRLTLVRRALELTLRDYPDDRYARSLYARFACFTVWYPIAAREFDRLGDRYWPRVFPTQADYDQFLAWSRTHRPQSPPPVPPPAPRRID